MTMHTPGPWVFSFESVDPEWAIVTTAGGSVVANVNADHRQDANAHLIAAAPEMLAALKALFQHHPSAFVVSSGLPLADGLAAKPEIMALRAGLAAIAKAEGR